MTAKVLLAIAAAALAGCNVLLGLDKNPSLNNQGQIDAAIDMAPIDMMTIDMDTSACAGMNCGVFGCDTNANMCRPAKLWVFLTTGAFFGNGFGGTDNPPDVRATSDTLCFTTVSQSFANRACSRNRTHAIITVAGADSIQSMAALYSIPTTVEVHRADDDVLAADTWNVLTGTTAIRAPVASDATAPTDTDGVVWTGFGGGTASNCTGWTSKLNTVPGVTGQARSTLANWLGPSSTTCNLLERLICVCWSGGN